MVRKRDLHSSYLILIILGIALLFGLSLSNVEADREGSLTASELAEIQFAKETIAQSGEIKDFTPMYDILRSKTGDKDKLLDICGEFDEDFLFCLSKASQLNPDLREDICDELVSKIRSRYQERLTFEQLNKFSEGYRQQCMLGIPKYMY